MCALAYLRGYNASASKAEVVSWPTYRGIAPAPVKLNVCFGLLTVVQRQRHQRRSCALAYLRGYSASKAEVVPWPTDGGIASAPVRMCALAYLRWYNASATKDEVVPWPTYGGTEPAKLK